MDTYEKKYKESLALMVDCIPDEDGYVHVRPQDIFTELKGSGDEKIRKTLIDFFQDWRKNRSHCWGISVPEILAWLEKQGEQKSTDEDMKEALRTEYEKGRADAIAEMQKSWSEKDEKILKEIISDVKFEGYNNDMLANSYKKINFLKSLKQRYAWKPSDEQIVVLELASKYERVFTPKQIDILIGLKEQLKKLKGE